MKGAGRSSVPDDASTVVRESKILEITKLEDVLYVRHAGSGRMALDRFDAEREQLDPGVGQVETAELVVGDDVLVKLFALGPGSTVEPHEHDDSTNVFHVLEGTVTVMQGDEEHEHEDVAAPGVVLHERGVVHGARNDTDETVVFTASLCPLPS
jgi:quercetin dioxygenase-like cupin family protein